MKFLNLFIFLRVIFALLILDTDPDPDYESGSTDLIEPGSEKLLGNTGSTGTGTFYSSLGKLCNKSYFHFHPDVDIAVFSTPHLQNITMIQ